MGFSFLSLCITLSFLMFCYECNVGAVVAVQDEWAVLIHGGIDTANEIAETHGFICVGQIGNLVNHYRFIGNKKEVGLDYRQFESKLKRNDKVIEVIPQSRFKRVQKHYTVPQDPKFPNQWSLNNTGQTNGSAGLDLNVERAWLQNLTGAGILVGVVDSGVQGDVDDIRENYDSRASYDFVDFDEDSSPDPSEDGATHGTNCAGEIAMVKNDKCGVGVAYRSKIAGLRIGLYTLTGTTDAEEADALGHMDQDIMVYSNSWGPPDDGYSFVGPDTLVKETFMTGSIKGRNGKGSVYVFSSGNGGGENRRFDSCAADGFVNSRYTIAIGSADESGKQAFYDESCTAKMAVTYSLNTPHYTDEDKSQQLVTVDLSNQCTDNFTGTSASAPLVSGTIALVLEKNPNLSWRDIQYLIAYTSDTTKLQDDSFTTNGAGLKVSSQFGFGAIDAEAMVTRATHWTNVPPDKSFTMVIKSTEQQIKLDSDYVLSFDTESDFNTIEYTEHVVVTLNFKMISTVEKKFRIEDNCDIPLQFKKRRSTNSETKPCDFNTLWSDRGDITIKMVSPNGTESVLLPHRLCDICQNGLDNWSFMSVHHWGEYPKGVWNVTISFSNPSDSPTDETYIVLDGEQILEIYGVTKKPESVKRIPSSCDPACVRGCAASGSQYCDSCKNYRDPVTLECLDSCNKTVYNGYCLDYDPTHHPISAYSSTATISPSVRPQSSLSASEAAGITVGVVVGGIVLIILTILVILAVAWGIKKYKQRHAQYV